MRLANRTKDYTQIDALIREHIPRFLYNDGEGKWVRKLKRRFFFNLKFIFLLFRLQLVKLLNEEIILMIN